MNLTIKQLRLFLEVAQRGSMMHAAAALHLTAPAVSMHIKEIETQLGISLFDRKNRQASLSTAGEYFVVHAKRVLAQLKEAENAMARFKRLDHGSLTIGIVSTAAYFMPRLLTRFHNQHPGIEVTLRVVYNHEQSVALMDTAEVDFMVITRPLKALAASVEDFAANPLVFVCPPQHHLVGRTPVSLKALDGSKFIVREAGTRARELVDAFLADHRCTPQVIMEIPNTETIKQAVMAGMGIGFLSLQTVGLELRNELLRVPHIIDTPVMDTWRIVHLNSRVLSPAAEAFHSFILNRGRKDMGTLNSKLLSLAFKGKARAGR